jgi:hypothetical protein
MSDPVETFLDSQRPILTVVDQMLDEWKSEKLYQVPQLLLNMGARLNWDAKQLRKYDPIVRAYLKDHPVWYVTRGAHGGIMKRDEHDKKEAHKAAKQKATEELKAAIAAKNAAVAATVQPSGQDNTNI